MTPNEAVDLLARYAYRCAEYDSMLRHKDAEAAIKAQADAAVAVLRVALVQRRGDYYVLDATGQRVPLREALEAMGLLSSDGGK